MQVVLPRLAGVSIPVELVAAAAHASIFALVACFVAGAWEAWVASPPPTCRRLLWNMGGRAPQKGAPALVARFAEVCLPLLSHFCDVVCTMGCGWFLVVLSVGLPSGDPLGVSEGYRQPQHALKRPRTWTKTKRFYRENSL